MPNESGEALNDADEPKESCSGLHGLDPEAARIIGPVGLQLHKSYGGAIVQRDCCTLAKA